MPDTELIQKIRNVEKILLQYNPKTVIPVFIEAYLQNKPEGFEKTIDPGITTAQHVEIPVLLYLKHTEAEYSLKVVDIKTLDYPLIEEVFLKILPFLQSKRRKYNQYSEQNKYKVIQFAAFWTVEELSIFSNIELQKVQKVLDIFTLLPGSVDKTYNLQVENNPLFRRPFVKIQDQYIIPNILLLWESVKFLRYLMRVCSMSWTLQDIETIIETGREESLTLDYKDSRALSDKKELAKDVSAFANSAGGTIIYGVIEENNKPLKIDGGMNPKEKIKESIENCIVDRIKPRVQGVLIEPIDLPNGNQLFVLEIPQSNQAPHMVLHRYHKRFNFQSVPMEHYEIMDVLNRQRGPDLWLIISLTKSEYDVYSFSCPPVRFDVQLENRSIFPAHTAIITFWIENNLKLAEEYNGSYYSEPFEFEDGQTVLGFKKVFDFNPITPLFGTQGFGFTNPQDRFFPFWDIHITENAMKKIGPFVSKMRSQELRARIKWEIQAPYMSMRQGFATLILGPEYEPSTYLMPARLEAGIKLDSV